MARVTEKLDTQIPSSVLFYLAWQGEDLKVDRNAAATKPEMYIKKNITNLLTFCLIIIVKMYFVLQMNNNFYHGAVT